MVMIRRAHVRDAETIGEITARSYIEGGHIAPNNTHYLPVLRDAADRISKAEVLVAVEGDKLLGSVTIARFGTEYTDIAGPDELEFRMLAVAPDASGRGVGTALVREVLDRARAEAWSRVVLSSNPTMVAGQHIYRALGFRRCPQRDWYPLPDLLLLTFVREMDSRAGLDHE